MNVAHSPPQRAGVAQGLTLVLQSALPTMGVMLLVPVVPLLNAEYGTMPGAAYLIPSLLTVPALCIALFSVGAGALGDRFGRRALLIGALAGYGLVGMAPLMISSFPALLAARTALGLCEAVIIVLSATLIGDYFTGTARDRWLALISTVATLSAVLFAALSGALGAHYGWRAPSAMYGLALLFVPAMLLWTWEPQRVEASVQQRPAARLPWPHLARAGVITLLGGTLFYTLTIQQAFGLAALGVADPARIGLLVALSSLAVPIGSLVFWRVATVRVAILFAAEFALIGVFFILMSLARSDIEFTAAAFGALFAAGLIMPTMITYTMRALPFEVRARGTGIFQTCFALGQFASGLAVPFLARNVADGMLPAFGLLGAGALAIAVTAGLRGARQSREPLPLEGDTVAPSPTTRKRVLQ